jgi:hypothetical protein
MSYVISTIALCASVFAVLVSCGIVSVSKPKTDKFDKYRDKDGLLRGKKDD